MDKSGAANSRDGAKRRGVSLGPQASEILQRLYEPQLGPNAVPSPSKSSLSPVKHGPRTTVTAISGGSTAGGGGGALKPRLQAGMKKNASVVTLSGNEPPAHARGGTGTFQPPPATAVAAGSMLGSSASVACLPVGVMHPSLQQVCAHVSRLSCRVRVLTSSISLPGV